MKEWLEENFPVRVEECNGRGRCVIASQDIPKGSIILAARSAALFPIDSNTCCSVCFSRPSVEKPNLLRCSSCKVTFYCSPACQKADWVKNHKVECKHMNWLKKFDRFSRSNLLLLNRLLRGIELDVSVPQGTGATPQSYVHTFQDVLSMHVTAFDESSMEVRIISQQIEECLLQRFIVFDGDVERRLGCSGINEAKQKMLNIILSFGCNNIAVMNDLFDGIATAVNPMGALLNHSCVPNCIPIFQTELEYLRDNLYQNTSVEERNSSETKRRLGELTKFADNSVRNVCMFRTLVDVPAGSELCHTYVDVLLPHTSRRSYLKSTYGFQCVCLGCDSDAMAMSDFSSHLRNAEPFVDSKTPSKYVHEPVTFLPLLSMSEIIDQDVMPERTGSVSLDHQTHDVIAPSESDSSCKISHEHGDCGHPMDSLSSIGDLISQLKQDPDAVYTSMRNANAPLFLSFEQSPEASFLVQRAVAITGASRKDLTSIAFSAFVLEDRLTFLRKKLHPLHTLVVQCVTALSDAYVILADSAAAAAAMEHLIASYAHAYKRIVAPSSFDSSPSGDVVIYPLMAMQAFTLADVYTSLAMNPPSSTSPPNPAARVARLRMLFVQLGDFDVSNSGITRAFADNVEGDGGKVYGVDSVSGGARVCPVREPLLDGGKSDVLLWLRRAACYYKLIIASLTVTLGPLHELVRLATTNLANIQDSLDVMNEGPSGNDSFIY